jgi:hypothetical protein
MIASDLRYLVDFSGQFSPRLERKNAKITIAGDIFIIHRA